MADIAKCAGTGCERKEQCYRWTALESEWRQSWIGVVPLKEDGECEWFWKDEGKQFEIA